MLRFFLGLFFGVVLTVYSFALVGVGHGTFVPMVFTASLIALITNWGVIPALLLAPLLWALYFLLIPRIQKKSLRIATTLVVLSSHVLSGIWLGSEDPAFTRALSQERGGLLVFELLLVMTVTCLFYFVVRGVKRDNS